MTRSSSLHYYGLPNAAAKAYWLCRKVLTKQPQLLFVSHEDLDDFVAAAHTFAPADTRILSFPATKAGQMNFLHQLLALLSTPQIICVPYEALSLPLPAPEEFIRRTRTLHAREMLRRQELLDLLEQNGFERDDYAENPGQYAARGSVVDIFGQYPLRLYFAGNQIESITRFDLDTRAATTAVSEACLLPLSFEKHPATLMDYLPHTYTVLDEPESTCLCARDALITRLPTPGGHNCQLQANIPFQANIDLLVEETQRLCAQHLAVHITCLNTGELERITSLLEDKPITKKIHFEITPLTQGFIDPGAHCAFITSNEIFNRRFTAARILKRFDIENTKRVRFKELKAGDYVVHQDHGIGRYLGLEVIHAMGTATDCITIEYRNGRRLYIPLQDFKKIHKYMSADGKRPTLAALGGISWQEVKEHVKEDAQKAAQEILKLEALRQASPAPQIIGNPALEQAFADSFPYLLTPGQEQAVQDVLSDLDQPKPMDRVLVGDVGFGKTEVALRAAVKVALSGKQVMLLAPTTILADQHYKTCQKRLAGFPLQVRLLCRFQTAGEQKQVLRELKAGVCDLIIGTHRLLSKDVAFKDLGLVIIDEEHRFGVKQKEKIRSLRAGVHSLMLSATPIPRTLNQSLSALRDISIIDTPPRGRNPIKTIVSPWNEEVAAAAIIQELARGGQVFYVYNRVRNMQERLQFLHQLVPQARIAMAHGQLNEKELEQTLWDFNQGKQDVLLASTIVESGLDITNANTLIVEDAQNFGLAQLYQLRGRIGRGDHKAYCYLFHPPWLSNTPVPQDPKLSFSPWEPSPAQDPAQAARARLAALVEFEELGSGFRLALRDMEIRGAGELLGVRQHGYINKVGLTLYCDLVANEVKKLKGVLPVRRLQAKLNLPIEAFIPPDYLPDEAERLKTYKELMSADDTLTAQVLARLKDQCGPIPTETENLVQGIALSHKAGALEIYQLDWKQEGLELLFTSRFSMPAELPAQLLKQYGPTHVRFLQTKTGYGLRLEPTQSTPPLVFARQVLTFLHGLITP